MRGTIIKMKLETNCMVLARGVILNSTSQEHWSISPGTPRGTCARCWSHRCSPAPEAHRASACPRTPAHSPPAPPRYRRSPRPAVYPWDVPREVRTAAARDRSGKPVSEFCLPFCVQYPISSPAHSLDPGALRSGRPC